MLESLYQILFIVFIPIILCFELFKKTKFYIISFNAFYLLLALLVAFRYGVGIDTINYMIAFDYIPPVDKLSLLDFSSFRFQPLYTLINSICKSIYPDFVSVQILHAILFYHSLYLLLRKFNLRLFYILFIIFCSMYFGPGMQMMREGFALAFCFYALLFYLKNKYILYYILVFVGFGFHSGVVVFFILPILGYIVKKYKYDRKVFFLFVLVCVIALYSLDSITSIFSGLGDSSIERYKAIDSHVSFSYTAAIRVFIVIFILYTKTFKTKKIEASYFYFGILSLLLDFFAASYMPILFRIASYFILFYLICVDTMFGQIKNNKLLFVFACIFIFYQPFARGINELFISENTARYEKYCSVFSSSEDKSYYQKMKMSFSAFDYFR